MIRILRKYLMPVVLILLIPQVANLLTCTMLISKHLHNIPMAVYMGDDTALTRNIVKAFHDSETFRIVEYVDSPDQLVEDVRQNKIIYGLAIPKGFTSDLQKLKAPSLLTIVDGSQLSAASFARIGSSDILLTLKARVLEPYLRQSFKMTSETAHSAAASLTFNSRLLGNPTRNYLNFLMPGMMTALAQVGLCMAASVSISREKRRSLATYTGSKVLAYTVIGFCSMLTILMVQVFGFGVPIKCGWMPVVWLTLFFSFCVSSCGIMLSTIFWDKVFATQVAALVFLPSTILSGYTWPLMAMPKFYQVISWYLPFTHYGDPIRDLMLKGSSPVFSNSILFFSVSAFVFWGFGMGCETLRERIAERKGSSVEAA